MNYATQNKTFTGYKPTTVATLATMYQQATKFHSSNTDQAQTEKTVVQGEESQTMVQETWQGKNMQQSFMKACDISVRMGTKKQKPIKNLSVTIIAEEE